MYGAVDIPIPDRWLIVPIDHIELDVDVGGGGRITPVGGVHFQPVAFSLFFLVLFRGFVCENFAAFLGEFQIFSIIWQPGCGLVLNDSIS